jgi:hypothetical protein
MTESGLVLFVCFFFFFVLGLFLTYDVRATFVRAGGCTGVREV